VDASGEVQYRYLGKFKPSDTGGNAILCTELSMDSFVYPASLNYFANKEGLTLQVLCRVGTGENLVAFEGKLVK